MWQKYASDGSPIQAEGPPGAGGIAVSADGNLYSTGTIHLTGAGAVVVSSNGQTISISAPAQTNQSLGLYALGNTTGQSSSSTRDARTVSIHGAGIVSVGMSGGSIVISAAAGAQSVQTQNLHNVTLSGNTSGALAEVSSGTLTLAGGNNITLSQDGNAVTISGASIPAQTAQTVGLYAVGNTTGESSSTTRDARSVSVDGAGIVSVGYSAGTLRISASQSSQVQSAQTVGLYALNQTTGESSSSTRDARSLSFAGYGGVSAGISGGTVVISGPTTAAQTAQTLGLYAVGNTTGESSSTTRDARSISVDGAGAVSVGYSGGTLRISAPVQTVQTQNLIALTLDGNTSGALALVSSGTLTLAGGNNITLSQAGNAVTISAAAAVAQTNQTVGLYAVGNTTGESSSTTRDARSISFDGAGIVSVGYSGGTLRISASVAAQSAESQSGGISNLGNTAGTSGIASGAQVRLLLAGGNNVTLSQSVNGASATITISGPNTAAQSAQTIGLYASSQTTGASSSSTADARSVTIVGRGAVSAGWTNGSFQISAPDTIAQTAESQTFGASNLGNTLGTSGVASGAQVRFVLVGSSNVTLSQSINGASGTITINAANQTVESQTFGASNLGNTAGTSGVASGGQVQFVLVGSSNVTLSQSINGASGTITINAANQTVESQSIGMSNLGNTSGTTGIASGGQVRFVFVGGDNITLSQSLNGASGTISISGPAAGGQTVQSLGLYAVGNTTGESSSTTRDARSISVDGAGGISVGYSAGTLRISGPTGGGGGSVSIGASNLGNTLGTSGMASGSDVRFAIVGTDWLTLSQSINGASGTITIDPPGYISRFEHNMAALYSSSTSAMVNSSPSFMRFSVPWPLSFSRIDWPVSISGATQSSTNTAANRLSWFYAIYTRNGSTITPIVGGQSSETYSWASNTGVYSSLTGPRLLSFNLATALTPGEYYFMVQGSTSTYSHTAAANTTNLGFTLAPVFGTSYSVLPWRNMSAATAATINDLMHMQGMGSISISATNQTYQVSDMTLSGATQARANHILIFRNV